MQTQNPIQIRLGMLALVLSGVLSIVGILLRGEFVRPASNPTGFAQLASAPTFTSAWLVIILGFPLVIFGLLALFAALANSPAKWLAFWGMVFSVAGRTLVLPLFGAVMLAWPVVGRLYLQGQKDVIEVAAASSSGAGAILLYMASPSTLLGTILFGIAIWRSGILPRWAAIPFVISVLLLAFPISFATELLGAVVWLIAAGWIAWHIWKSTAKDPF